MKAAFFTIGGRQRGSSRLRVLQLLAPLAATGVTSRTLAWDGRRGMGKVTYTAKAIELARWADVVVLQKPHQPRWLVDIVRRLAPVVVDIDDAVWAPISTAAEHLAQARERESRLRHAIEVSGAVMTGSAYLEAWVHERFAGVTTAVVPPALDVARYSVAAHGDHAPVVVGWIGSPVNFGDLEVVAPVLAALRADNAACPRVVSSERPPVDGVDFVPWSEATEINELARFDIGIMPLVDDDRSRGRCGFKAVQYAAAGLPVVTARVGAAPEVVDDGVTGYVVDDLDGWAARLGALATDTSLRAAMGRAGRERAEKRYDLARAADEVRTVLTGVVS